MKFILILRAKWYVESANVKSSHRDIVTQWRDINCIVKLSFYRFILFNAKRTLAFDSSFFLPFFFLVAARCSGNSLANRSRGFVTQRGCARGDRKKSYFDSGPLTNGRGTETMKPCLTSPSTLRFFVSPTNGDKNPVARFACRLSPPRRKCTQKKPIEEVKKCRRGRGNHYFNFRTATVSRGIKTMRDKGREGAREREREVVSKIGVRIVTKEGRKRDGWVLLCIIFVWGGVSRDAKDSLGRSFARRSDSRCLGYEERECFASRRIKLRSGPAPDEARNPSSPTRNYPKERL